MKKIHFILFISLFLTSCIKVAHEDQIHDKDLTEAVKNRKVKRLKDSEIMSLAHEKAQLVLSFLPKTDSSFCNQTWTNLPDSASLKAVDKLVFWCQKQKEMQKVEGEIFEAYQYSTKNGDKLKDNIQKTSRDTFLYTKVIQDSTGFVGMWSIWLKQKELILEIM
jgi:hypothetical protein